MNKQLNQVLDKQKNNKNLEEEDLDEEVNLGVEERLNKVTRNNLKLKNQIKDMHEVIRKKNTHISKLLKEISELKEKEVQKDTQLKEIKQILEEKDDQIKKIENDQYFDPNKLKVQLDNQKVIFFKSYHRMIYWNIKFTMIMKLIKMISIFGRLPMMKILLGMKWSSKE